MKLREIRQIKAKLLQMRAEYYSSNAGDTLLVEVGKPYNLKKITGQRNAVKTYIIMKGGHIVNSTYRGRFIYATINGKAVTLCYSRGIDNTFTAMQAEHLTNRAGGLYIGCTKLHEAMERIDGIGLPSE